MGQRVGMGPSFSGGASAAAASGSPARRCPSGLVLRVKYEKRCIENARFKGTVEHPEEGDPRSGVRPLLDYEFS